MAQTGLPAVAVLGVENTGLAIGYRVLNVDRSLYSAFTTVGVSESITGIYVVAGGVTAPDEGGYAIFGTSGTDIGEATIPPAVPAAPAASVIVTAIMAYAVETGHTLETILEALYAVIRGRAVGDDANDPTQIIYYAPDGTTPRVTHTLTSTTRTPS